MKIEVTGRSDAGFSLMELMVSLGLAGIVFLALMTLLTQSARYSGYFHSSAGVTEGMSDAITQMNTAVSQIVLIQRCGCRGASSTNLSNCLWDDTSAASAWYDPVRNGGAADSGNGGLGHEILAGQFEGFFGGDSTNNTSQLLTGNLGTFGAGIGGCETHASFASTDNRRGCKQQIRLFYKAPTNDAGSVPGSAGAFSVLVGNAAASTSAAGLMRIGSTTSRGMSGLGVTELACGFNRAAGANTVSGVLFVLNLKLKGRSNTVLSPTNSQYESWHPSGAGYRKGMLRDIQLKFTFRNLGSRGLYYWRPQTVRGCKASGLAATNREECCSGALAAGVCLGQCVGAGVAAASATACCSEQLLAGACR